MLKAHGWECHGTELTAESAFRASQSGISVSVGEFQREQFPPGSFDLISFWQVLEHLPEPWKFLQRLRPLLKKGGIVAISTPNVESLQAKLAKGQWFHLDAPRHLCLFSPRTLGAMMGSLGFRTVEVHHFSMEQNPYGWLQSLLNLSGLPYDSLYTILKTQSPARRDFLTSLEKGKMLLLAAGLSPLCLFLSLGVAFLGRGDTIEAYFRLETA
jgi:SAM-dependent methyltransferase